MAGINCETCGPGRTPDDDLNPRARRLFQEIQDELAMPDDLGWAPEWDARLTDEQWFPEEASTPEARRVASYVLSRIMSSLEHPYLHEGTIVNTQTIWQMYDHYRTTINRSQTQNGEPIVDIQLTHILGAAKRDEAWLRHIDDFYDRPPSLGITAYQTLQTSIAAALKPPYSPTS